MVLGYFIGLEVVNHALKRMDGMFMSSLVEILGSNNNLIGILRVLLPLLLFITGYVLRRLGRYGMHGFRRMCVCLHRSRARFAAMRKSRRKFEVRARAANFLSRGKLLGRIIRGRINPCVSGETEKAK